MRKLNNYHLIGLLFLGIYLFSITFNLLPTFLECFFMGISLAFTLIGAYAYNHDMSKLRNYKMNLFRKYLKRL